MTSIQTLLIALAAMVGGLCGMLVMFIVQARARAREEARLAAERNEMMNQAQVWRERAQQLQEQSAHWQAQSEALQNHLNSAQTRIATLDALNQQVPALQEALEAEKAAQQAWRHDFNEQNMRLLTQHEHIAHLKIVETRFHDLEAEHEALQRRFHDVSLQLERLSAQSTQERRAQEEKIQLLHEARESLGDQFKNLANEILEEKSRRFTEHNQTQMGQLLHPLQEKIQTFGQLVENTYAKDARERLSLEVELKNLQELNKRLGDDALALTQALTGQNNKTQGNWGEMILEKVLENSGLVKGREYEVQAASSHVDEHGQTRRLQPDVLVHLPENKQIIIDAKVSLTAYVQYTRAQTDEARANALKAHLQSVRSHLKSLSEKRYQDMASVNSLDYVLMFVPVEPAYLLALQEDENLYHDSFERRIMLVGPSTLLATMRTIAGIWRYQHQNQNAEEIARQGGQLYDKFVGFVTTLNAVGKRIDEAQGEYNKALNQLTTGRGNLVNRAQKLHALGAKTGKKLDMLYEEDEPGIASGSLEP